MTLDEIKALIDAMGSSDLAEMEVARGGWTLRLVRHASPHTGARPPAEPARAAPEASPAPVPPRAPATKPKAAASPDVRAPLAGIVYLSPAPDAAPFVSVGQAVEAGALLCTVEAMKTFNEVRAERAGIVEAVLVGPGDEVGAGQPLFRLGGAS